MKFLLLFLALVPSALKAREWSPTQANLKAAMEDSSNWIRILESEPELRQDLCPQSQEPLKITIAIGFFNEGTRIGNPHVAANLREAMLTPCDGSRYLCGFKTRDGFSFTKAAQKIAGQSHRGARIVLINAIESDEISQLPSTQEERNKTAEAAFLAAAQSSQDALFYFGHSRRGAGPDFLNPHMNAEGEINWDAYQKREGWQRFLAALKKGFAEKKQPKLYGSISCDSRNEYYSDLHPLGMELILSRNIALGIEAQNALGISVDSILAERCSKSADKLLIESALIFSHMAK